jgi:adenylate kinase family enzyme
MKVLLLSKKEVSKQYIHIFIYMNSKKHKEIEYWNNPTVIQKNVKVYDKLSHMVIKYYSKMKKRNLTEEDLKDEIK